MAVPAHAIRRSGEASWGHPTMGMVNATLDYFTQFRRRLDEMLPQSAEFRGEFHLLLRSYGTMLLTMIKNVLIPGISFAPLCQ
jgi:hypothetical protein